MSDLQDLIHKTSMDCLAKGKQQEQERIIKLLEQRKDLVKKSERETGVLTAMREVVDTRCTLLVTEALIYAIKGEK